MRSVKTQGGLTRGRGWGEGVERNTEDSLAWLLSMPACAEMNAAMLDFT